MKATTLFVLVSAVAAASFTHASAQAETMTKQGTNAAGQTCTVTVNRNADGSITTAGASGGSGTAGALSSSSTAGGSSVQVQAGGGSVSSSTTMPGSSTGSSASTVTVNGCTISTSSP